MILAGIDVAKDKHDCFIMNSDGEILVKAFTFSNNLEGFNFLYEKIRSVTKHALITETNLSKFCDDILINAIFLESCKTFISFL